MDLTHEQKIEKKQIVRDELKGKIKHLYMSFLSEKETQYPPCLSKDDVINVLSSLINDETKLNDKNESYNCGAFGIKCKRVVGVIASNNDDFLNWKDVDAGFDNIPLKKQRVFIDNDVLYYGIIKIDHIHSITFDEVIETKNAKENSEYDRIMYAIKPVLGRR